MEEIHSFRVTELRYLGIVYCNSLHYFIQLAERLENSFTCPIFLCRFCLGLWDGWPCSLSLYMVFYTPGICISSLLDWDSNAVGVQGHVAIWYMNKINFYLLLQYSYVARSCCVKSFLLLCGG